ncbi:MAG: CsbD family protein [Anaerolineae bacterium]|nr:CsbD family protein [Anaerolineae bacterium]
MSTDILQGKWGEISGEVKKQWGRLTDDDLLKIEGQRDKLEGALRKRYGFSRKAAEEEVDSFLEDAESRLKSLRHLLRRRVSQAQDRAQDTAESVRDSVGTRADDVNEQMSTSLPDDVVYVVEEYPWVVVIGVLVAGILIGLLLGPKSR